ncbi:MAG: hypothetical protein M1324_04765 [Patescibacteria group bacterium]|nr:hypothetical protein [Patescibacteria group bacterium]
MKLFNFIKQKTKRLFAITAILVLAMQLFLPSIAKAGDFPPEFMTEKKLLRGLNLTNNQQDWTDSVSGKSSDEFRGLVWVHNGVPGTTAHNTVVKVTIPSGTTNKTAAVSANLSASDANRLSDTLNVNLTDDANISFIPGTVKLFKVDEQNKTVQVPFPGGNGDALVSANGVNIGDIQGCFQFVNFISFGFKATPKVIPPVQNANFEIVKSVRNASANEKDFVKSNFAQPGDILEYKIDFSNTGNAAADVFIQDQIPAKTTFVSGSASITRTSDPKLSDSLVGEGVSISSVAPGEKVTIKFRVKVNSNAKDNEVLVNTVTLFFNKISISDTAKTTVKVAVIPTPPTPEKPTPLPVTGPVETASALVSLSGMGIFGFIKYRKFMALKETKMIGELLNQ